MNLADLKAITVNFHLTRHCDMKCRGCYAGFHGRSFISTEQWIQIIKKVTYALRTVPVLKINFVGGEPLLYKDLLILIQAAKSAGSLTSLVTNGFQLYHHTNSHLLDNLDWVGISIDSLNDETNKSLGRVTTRGGLSEKQYSDLCRRVKSSGVKLKINTVISKENHAEDFSTFIESVQPDRWKVMERILVEGENEKEIGMIPTDQQFKQFKSNHRSCPEMIAEKESDLRQTYLMISPDGCLFSSSTGEYQYSNPLTEVSLQEALKDIPFNLEGFKKRQGEYFAKD